MASSAKTVQSRHYLSLVAENCPPIHQLSRTNAALSPTLAVESLFLNQIQQDKLLVPGLWSRSRVFKNAGVGVSFLKLLQSESVYQNCWSRSRNPKKSSDSTTLVSASP